MFTNYSKMAEIPKNGYENWHYKNGYEINYCASYGMYFSQKLGSADEETIKENILINLHINKKWHCWFKSMRKKKQDVDSRDLPWYAALMAIFRTLGMNYHDHTFNALQF